MEFKDIIYEERDSVAYIAINRPEVMNAFRGQTVEELLQAFMKAGWLGQAHRRHCAHGHG